jgi:V8-like Glu-specific endopeptidase
LVAATAALGSDDTKWQATGFLIGPRVVVTAGFVLYDHQSAAGGKSRGGKVKQVTVIPGRNGQQDSPYGAQIVTNPDSFRIADAWVKEQGPGASYGAIILPEPFLGVGWLGYSSMSDLELRKERVVVVPGYPVTKLPRYTMWESHGRMLAVSPEIIRYWASTGPGTSGAPVLLDNGEGFSAVGIHTLSEATGKAGVRITGSVIDNFERWNAEAE